MCTLKTVLHPIYFSDRNNRNMKALIVLAMALVILGDPWTETERDVAENKALRAKIERLLDAEAKLIFMSLYESL